MKAISSSSVLSVMFFYSSMYLSDGFQIRKIIHKLPAKIIRSQSLSMQTESVKSPKTIGFIGLGIMGDGMSRMMVKNGLSLSVWNRSVEKSKKLKSEYKEKVEIMNKPGDVILNSDITFLMLSTPQACDEVYNGNDGILNYISKGKSIIDCATLEPLNMIKISAAVKAKGGLFLEAPVSGSKVPAETGQLIFLTAGDKELYDKSLPYFNMMGKSSHFYGDIGEGTKMKLIINSIMANMLATLAQGIALTEV